ncbi:hypothetical protein ElyMa_003064900 [Elysia marginata]|uniref:Uncharacterized protein n=1 Tax=Elysia marginata TaxID=1093978 RepID=A0AAV4IME1_9GAST|nr:hypothetical protein ElyMa_003064900 [Elysia marginata]
MTWSGIEPTTSRSQVRRANHSATLPPYSVRVQCAKDIMWHRHSRDDKTLLQTHHPHLAGQASEQVSCEGEYPVGQGRRVRVLATPTSPGQPGRPRAGLDQADASVLG